MTWKTICEKIAAGRNREENNASILFITVSLSDSTMKV